MALATAAALAGVSGCSFRVSVTEASSGPSAAPTARGPVSPGTGATGTTASGSPAPRPARCHTGDLTAGLVPESPTAGQRYAVLVLTNASGRACTVYGYGGIGLVDPAGAPLPTTQQRVAPPAPVLITLRPQQTARSQLQWSAVPGGGDAPAGPCAPTPAALRVIPPDETAALAVPWTQGPVCAQGTIEQRPYAATAG